VPHLTAAISDLHDVQPNTDIGFEIVGVTHLNRSDYAFV
jgi:hypothetical protein